MSLKKYLMSGAAALALVGTAASAVTVECDGTGDYLLAPVYYAIDFGAQEWETELKVVNTNTTNAVVAKVVVRDGNQSKEIIDFPIYLTPGDVWTGKLYYNENDGKVHVYSEDDSLMLGTVVHKDECDENNQSDDIYWVTPKFQASAATPFDKAVKLAGYDGVRQTRGYVEVYGLASYPASVIAGAYGDTFQEGCDLNKTIFFSYTRYPAVHGDIADLNESNASDVANSDLMGVQTIVANTSDDKLKRSMMLNMFALGDVATEAKTDTVIASNTDLTKVSDLGTAGYRTLATLLAKKHVYAVYEGDGNKLSPMRVHFTMPFRDQMLDAGVEGLASYTLNTKDDIIFRDMEEHAHRDCVTCPTHTAEWPKCPDSNGGSGNGTGGSDVDDELSGGTSTCTPDEYTYNEEVSIIIDSAKDPMKTKAFKVGGYVDIALADRNITVDGEVLGQVKGLPVVPTSFYAKKVGDGFYLNNHLYNQYNKAGANDNND